MKKANFLVGVLMVFFVAVMSYFIFFTKPKYNYSEYDLRKEELLNTISYSSYNNHFEIKANVTTLANGKYSIVITIDNIQKRLDNVKLLLISGNEKLTPTDTLYPSKNILFKEEFALIPLGLETSDKAKHGINLNFISEEEVNIVYIFISFVGDEGLETLYIQKSLD